MRVKCDIEFVDLESDSGREIESVMAVCTRCDHKTESFGTESASVRRCLALMREECPEGENNFYYSDNEE